MLATMNNPSFKTQMALNLSNLSLLLFSFFIVTTPALLAQDAATDLTKALAARKKSTPIGSMMSSSAAPMASGAAADGYKSFVQNELQSIFLRREN